MTDESSLGALERDIHGLIFGDPAGAVPGVSTEAQAIYRRLARNNLMHAVKNALPIARGILGDDSCERLIAHFLATAPPKTRLLRDVPIEFSTWARTATHEVLCPALRELIHFEVVEVEVLHAPDPEPGDAADLSRHPALDVRLMVHPSARLLAYAYPVHKLRRGATRLPASSPAPTFLLAWRTEERFRFLTIPSVVAKFVAIADDDVSLGSAFEVLEAEHPGQVHREVVFQALLDFVAHGALIGFTPGAQS